MGNEGGALRDTYLLTLHNETTACETMAAYTII